MKNSLLRSLSIGFCVFAATILIALISFFVSYRISAKKAAEAIASAEKLVNAEDKPRSLSEITADYYLAVLEDESVLLYACTENSEEFLYAIDIPITEISSTELEQLKKGIILKDKAALASFEEDFTS